MEIEFVKWLATKLSSPPKLAVGIGDDAAVIDVPEKRQVVVTTDMVTDGEHFDLRSHSPERVGRKALAVNLSDLAAMAAEPLAAVVSINVPRAQATSPLPRELITGMLPLAERYHCSLAGGDTNVAEGPLAISITAIGTVAPGTAWLRSGARPGDRLLVTGKLGGSLLRHHLDFEPRVFEARELQQRYDIHAAMDISDGLGLDLSRMVEASGVGAIVDVLRIPIADDARKIAETSGKLPLAHAMGDGEDFELLIAVPPPIAEKMLVEQPLACGLTDVGEFTQRPGLFKRDAAGRLAELQVTGFQHGSLER